MSWDKFKTNNEVRGLYHLHQAWFNDINYYLRKNLELPVMPNPVTEEWIDSVRGKKSLVMKEQLEIGKLYSGKCRNAHIAIWDGDKFTYIREKFGRRFKENINHFEDDDEFDVFCPYFKIKDKFMELPYIQEYLKELND